MIFATKIIFTTMKKTLFILTIFVGLVFPVQAQVNDRPKQAVHVAYLGEMLTHPGMSVGYESYLSNDSRFQVFLRANVGFYHHYRNNNTYMFTLESGFRRNFASGIFLEQSLGIGYFYRKVHGDGQFAVEEDGSIVEKNALGRSFVPFLANVGIGYHIQTKRAQISPFIRPNFYWKMPFNETPNMQMAMMAGILYGFK
jgi:hypothetical protein